MRHGPEAASGGRVAETQKTAFLISGRPFFWEPVVRFELTTCSLRMSCSTPELHWHSARKPPPGGASGRRETYDGRAGSAKTAAC